MIYLKIIINELKKELFCAWSYKGQWFGEFVSLLVFFFFLNTISANTAIAGISYCFWFYSVLIMGDISGKVSTEMHLGTFEQIYLSSIPITVLLISKAIAAVLRSICIMSILLGILFVFGNVNFSFFHYNVFVALFTITPGLFGISLLLGGLVLLLKDIWWVINIFNNAFLFLSGIFLSIESLPYSLQCISKVLPIAQAIEILNGRCASDKVFFIFLMNCTYLVLGFFFFYMCEKIAKKRGVLGCY